MLPSLRVPSASSINKYFFCSFFLARDKGTAQSQWAVAVAHWSFPGQTNFQFPISSLEILIVRFQIQNPENPSPTYRGMLRSRGGSNRLSRGSSRLVVGDYFPPPCGQSHGGWYEGGVIYKT